MIDPISGTLIGPVIYEIAKIWLPVGGLAFGLFQAWQWVKQKLINIDANTISVKTSIDHQTNAITDQFKELRSDFRTFFALNAAAQAPARAKRTRKPAVLDK
jgi:hypothetical protein